MGDPRERGENLFGRVTVRVARPYRNHCPVGRKRLCELRRRRRSRPVVADLQQKVETPEPEAESGPLDPELPVVEIDGNEYVGEISIPVIGIDLPVMSEWSYPRLKIAPCRQFGSSRTDDLVIAAHNYESHFGKLTSLTAGDSVTFTDMDGIVNEYVVNKVEVLDPHSVEEVEHSGYALVLYTCTYGGKTRVTVFCDRAS